MYICMYIYTYIRYTKLTITLSPKTDTCIGVKATFLFDAMKIMVLSLRGCL